MSLEHMYKLTDGRRTKKQPNRQVGPLAGQKPQGTALLVRARSSGLCIHARLKSLKAWQRGFESLQGHTTFWSQINQTGGKIVDCSKPGSVYRTESGIRCILTRHAVSRAANRHRGSMRPTYTKMYFEQLGKWIKETGYQPDYYNQEVFFYSKHLNRGAVVALRRDFNYPDSRQLCCVVVTFYPYGTTFPKQRSTERIFI